MNWFQIITREYLQPFYTTLPIIIGGLLSGYFVELLLLARMEIKIWEKIPLLYKKDKEMENSAKDDYSKKLELNFLISWYQFALHVLVLILFLYVAGFIVYWGNYGNDVSWNDVATLSFILGLNIFHTYLQIDAFRQRKYFRRQLPLRPDY